MEISEEQYARIKDSLPVQRGNVSLSNLQFLNAVLYVAEHGCKWRGFRNGLATRTPSTRG
jgi:transposase